MRIFILLSLLPVILNVIIAKIFGKRDKSQGETYKLNLVDFSKTLLKGSELKVGVSRKKYWGSLPLKSGELKLDEALVDSSAKGIGIGVDDLAEVVVNCGFSLLFLEKKKTVDAYFRSQRFISIIPVLAIIAALFMKLAGKVSFNISILIAVSGLAIASITGLFTLMTGFRALQLSLLTLTRSKGFLYSEQKEIVEKAAKAHLFRNAVPAMLKFIL